VLSVWNRCTAYSSICWIRTHYTTYLHLCIYYFSNIRYAIIPKFTQATEPLELPHAFGAMPAPIFERDPSTDDRIAGERAAANEAGAAAQACTVIVACA